MERPLMAQSGCSYWTKRLISRPRIPRRIFTAVPGPEKLEAQSKSRRDRQGRVAAGEEAEGEGPQTPRATTPPLSRNRPLFPEKEQPHRAWRVRSAQPAT